MANGYADLTVIIPTLNEEKSVGQVLRRISREYNGCEIVVVDDGSDDLTKQVVKGFAKQERRVRFFDRSATGMERGLTASIVYGIMRSTTKYVIVIDADLQHPTEKIHEMASRLRSGCDLVVASRARVTDWAAYRRIISRAFMYVGRAVLFVEAKETCADIFSGFFGIRRELFVSTYKKNSSRFVGEGYKILFDFLKCVDRGALRIGNVPFVFRTREFGSSKAEVTQGLALLRSFAS